ncbi:hypothetical protein Hanom_Chr03g00190811 [Helianthus anomalus]
MSYESDGVTSSMCSKSEVCARKMVTKYTHERREQYEQVETVQICNDLCLKLHRLETIH